MVTLPDLKAFRYWKEFEGCPIVRLCGVKWWGDRGETSGDLHYQRNGLILICEDNDPHAWRAQTITVFPRQYCDVEADGEIAPTPEFALSELLACLLSSQAALIAALRAVELREWQSRLFPSDGGSFRLDPWHGSRRPGNKDTQCVIHLVSTRRRTLFGPPTETEEWWIGSAKGFPHADGLEIEVQGRTREAVLRKMRRELQSGALRARLNARYIEWILKEARASR